MNMRAREPIKISEEGASGPKIERDITKALRYSSQLFQMLERSTG